ncbi:protein spire homolog 1 isoform X2 [Triplophysa dalaica]|uniref:protein spire homolog 1 isoform X2 n=1 Tax=Triplophysa dalaica TaxID=1582913 RepID=UPI0024DF4503|nr:protein spire homolog 1 isoform X2 [Triplophysa dalaica]
MDLCPYDINPSCDDQMSLSEILQVQDQPVSEEQAWALCYQLCSLLRQHQSRHKTWTRVVLPAADGVVFSRDGNISLRVTDDGTNTVMETEEQAVEFVGRLIYSCLDWGLETQVERELNETLEILVCQMTKVNLSFCDSKPMCTVSNVIQVCKHRLYDPAQATQHYKNVCSILFLHTVELCHYLQMVQQSRKSLQKLIIESEPNLIVRVTTNLVSGWKDLVDELNRGVVLRPLTKCVNGTKSPLPVETAPFDQLLLDIQRRRYTLRKVQSVVDDQRKQDPHQTLLEYIRSRPKLRPASERKMEIKPKEQTCLHELLMQEIRSTNHWKRLAHNRPLASNSLTDYEENEDTFHLKPTPQRKNWDEAPHQQHTEFTDLNVFTGKRRTKSFASNRDFFKVVKGSPKVAVLTTIVDVKKMHNSYKGDVKNMMCERYSDWRVCSCCASRSLYFTWHKVCSLCSRVICSACCVEMRLPSKWCVNLPLGFFKQIVMKDGEQSQRNFWTERWSWDSAWIPLVLVSCGPSSTSVHSLAMRDWYSQDICVCCQTLLLETCDSMLSSCPIKDSQEI